MRIVFAGTPGFAVPSLHAAMGKGDVVAVYTQPDRPAGRGRGLQPSMVKQAALEAGIEVRQPESLRTVEARKALRELQPDVMIVVAYGLILPQSILDIPVHGCWNVHASLLPRWRGAAPVQRAIEAGDTETGVCLMRMDKGLDTGPVYLRSSVAIGPNETGGELTERLSGLGAQVLGDGLGLLRIGLLPSAHAQATEGVTYAQKLEKHEAKLDWSETAAALANTVRAFNPWPIAEAMLDGERVRIHGAIAVPGGEGVTPGSIGGAGREGLDVATGHGLLRIRVLQREGGKAITAADYVNARRAH